MGSKGSRGGASLMPWLGMAQNQIRMKLGDSDGRSSPRVDDTMIPVLASDANRSDEERDTIGEPVRYLPVLKDLDPHRLTEMAKARLALSTDPGGLDPALAMIESEVPTRFREAAARAGPGLPHDTVDRQTICDGSHKTL